MLVLLGFVACDKSEILTYEDVDYIYFDAEVFDDDLFSQTKFSFVFEDDAVTEKAYEIPVLVTGKFAGRDRSFQFQIVDSLTTAVEGTHFIIEPNRQAIVDNQTGGNVILSLIRTPDLKENDYTIGVELIANDEFQPGINKVFVLTINDYYSEPDWWYRHEGYYPHIGPFNKTKGILWLEYWGITDGSNPWGEEPYHRGKSLSGYDLYDTQLCWATVNSFKAWLRQIEDTGEPIIDEETGLRVLDTFNY